MKKILIIFTLLTVFTNCSVTTRNKISNKNKQDTIVCSENILYDYSLHEEKEFFIVAQQDTSAYSFIFSQSTNGNIRMEVSFMKDCKMFFFNSDTNKKDTTAVGGFIKKHNSFHIPGYKNMLREMELCLNTASKDYDMQKLESVKCNINNLSDIAVLVNNELHDRQEPIKQHHKVIENALNKTTFKSDLNRIFNKYGICVNKIISQEFMGFIPKKDFLASQNIKEGLDVPDHFYDVEIYIELKRTE